MCGHGFPTPWVVNQCHVIAWFACVEFFGPEIDCIEALRTLPCCYFAMTSEPSNPWNPGQFVLNPDDWKMQLHQPTQQRSLHKCIVFRWFHLGTTRRSEWLTLSEDGRVRFRRITKSGKWLTWSLFPFFFEFSVCF